MAGDEGPQPTPQRRVEHIKQMAGEIGTQQREVMHLVMLTSQALYLFFALACITAGVVAEVNGKHTTALVWGALGGALLAIWLFVKVLAKSMKKLLRALKAEMARLPEELQQQLGREAGPGPGVRDAALAGLHGPKALRGFTPRTGAADTGTAHVRTTGARSAGTRSAHTFHRPRIGRHHGHGAAR